MKTKAEEIIDGPGTYREKAIQLARHAEKQGGNAYGQTLATLALTFAQLATAIAIECLETNR